MLRWTIFVVLIAAAGALGSEDKQIKAHRDEKKADVAPAGDELKIAKREAIILDSPPDGPPMFKRNVKVIYKKVPVRPKRYNSYAFKKPKRNSRPYNRGPTKSRRQTKKGRRNIKPRYSNKPSQISILNHAERSPSLGPWRPPSPPHSRGPPHSNSFGEPPIKFSLESKYKKPSQSYGEPPHNSYTQNIHTGYDDSEDLAGNLYDSYTNPGHIGVASNYRPGKNNPQSDYFIDQGGKFEPWHSSIYAKDVPYVSITKASKSKLKRTKHTTARPLQDEVFVGGQYAEPPGRYVKDQGSSPTIEDYEQVYSSGTKSNFDEDADVPGLTFYSDYSNVLKDGRKRIQ